MINRASARKYMEEMEQQRRRRRDRSRQEAERQQMQIDRVRSEIKARFKEANKESKRESLIKCRNR